MRDLSQAKIYKLISPSNPDKIYVGSTCLALKIRFQNHKAFYSRCLKINSGYSTSFEILKFDDAQIELIKEIMDEVEQELQHHEEAI